MIKRISAVAALLLLGACAFTPVVREPGPWTGHYYYQEAKHAAQTRFPQELKFDDGSRIKFMPNPNGRACFRVWQYDYMPSGRLAGPPQSIDVCP